MFNFIGILFAAREPKSGYFGGAEGALRFLVLAISAAVAVAVYFFLA